MPKLHPGQLPKVNEAGMRSTFVKLDPIETNSGFVNTTGPPGVSDHQNHSSKHGNQLSTSVQFQKGMLSQIDSRNMHQGSVNQSPSMKKGMKGSNVMNMSMYHSNKNSGVSASQNNPIPPRRIND